MKDSNPDCLVYTEPLHNQLFLEIQKEEQSRGEFSHGYPVMGEYGDAGELFLKRIRQMHPCLDGGVYSFRIDDVLKYIEIFDSLDRPAILQPNRMHFILSDVAKAFDCNVAHVIRHPLDVFSSVMFSSPKLKYLRNRFKINPYWLRAMRNPNPYFLDEQCDFVSRYFGYQTKIALFDKWVHPKEYYLKRFILSWTIANYYAAQEVDNVDGMIVRYEDIVTNPDTVKMLSEFSGVRFDSSEITVHRKSVAKHIKRDMSLCFALANKMQIADKFKFLVERFGYDS